MKTEQKKQQADLYSSFDLENINQIETLIHLVRTLDPTIENLRIVKKLMLYYRLPILIYLKPFFEKFPQQARKEHSENLKILGGIADDLVQHGTISRLGFLFLEGIKLPTNKITLNEDELRFVMLVQEIDSLNCSILENKIIMDSSEYQEQIRNKIKTLTLTKLMSRSLKDYCLGDQQIINAKKNQNNDDSYEKIEHDEINFYTQQEPNSDHNCLSFSLNNSCLGKEINSSLCCRRHFFEDELLYMKQNIRTAFLPYQFPFSEANSFQIQKSICYLLNCEGGKIYFGFKKEEAGKMRVISTIYTESQKEEIFKYFRKIASNIEPDIVTQKLYWVDFVPIKHMQTGEFIPGAFVIKVSVNYGIRDEVYSYRVDEYDIFPFRNDMQVIEKNGRQLLKLYRQIIRNPLSIPEPTHQHPCYKPDIGEPLYSKTKKRGENNLSQSFSQGASKLDSTKDMSNDRSKIETPSTLKPMETIKEKSDTISSSSLNKDKSFDSSAYFFIIGLGEKHLVPIFAEKNMKDHVQYESNRENRIVVRIEGQDEIEKGRKIFKKIQAKYKEKNIRIYEITMGIQIESRYSEALECIKGLKIRFKELGQNKIEFKLFKDSFQSFIELECKKIACKFIPNQGSISKK